MIPFIANDQVNYIHVKKVDMCDKPSTYMRVKSNIHLMLTEYIHLSLERDVNVTTDNCCFIHGVISDSTHYFYIRISSM